MISKEELIELKLSLNENTTIVAVSKTYPLTDIKQVMEMGITDFGENKLQELKSKFDPSLNIKWHFIGRIQTNKIKDIVKYASMIQSVDRLEVAELINKEAIKLNKIMPILIQINVLNEENKGGLSVDLLEKMLKECSKLSNIIVKGLMVIGPTNQIIEHTTLAFKTAKELFDKYKMVYPSIEYLSMGMSDDYLLAQEYGSNMVRIGSKIFGKRLYKEENV
jgi:hypothetical protein